MTDDAHHLLRDSLDSPARRLRYAIEPIATLGYHASTALEMYADRFGFDFLHAYVWMRTSSMGEPDPAVAAAAFGVWDTTSIETAYDEARATASLEQIRTLRLEAVTRSLREVLGDPEQVDGLDDTVTALEAAYGAASTLGKPLFAGLTGHPRPPDLLGRLWHATNALREHRGDAHLAALVGAGVDGVQANVLNELRHGFDLFAFTSTRRWSQERMEQALAGLEERGLVADAALTEDGARLLVAVETLTDAADEVVLDSLGDDLDRHVDRLDAWSARIAEHGWYPAEPHKRDAG